MGDSKTNKPPAPLIISHTTHTGTLAFKRHHLTCHSLHQHHHHDHCSHDEIIHSRVRLAPGHDTHDSRSALFLGPQLMNWGGSNSLQSGMLDIQGRSPYLPMADQLEVSSAVRKLRTTGVQQVLQLVHTYSPVSQTLNVIRLASKQLKQVGEGAEEVLQEFDAGDMGCRKESTSQINGIERFQEEFVPIQGLQERLGAEKRKVQMYRERLEKAQDKIDKLKEMELVWKQRASRRLRLLWGFVSILVILWLLSTASNGAERPHKDSMDAQMSQMDYSYTSLVDTTFRYEGVSRGLYSSNT